MSSASQPVTARLELGLSRLLASVPPSLERRLAGKPIEVDGQVLHPEAQAALRSQQRFGLDRLTSDPIVDRVRTARNTRLSHGRTFPVGRVEERRVPGAVGDLDARLYVPDGAGSAGPLQVYYHGGGFVVGDLDTHDQVCRLICAQAETRVLSVAYRLAPEHPFPAAVEDALAAYLHVSEDPGRFGAAPGAIAVGGDSAGGNLALNVSLLARDSDAAPPAYQALIYPACEFGRKWPSYELFGHGFYLTEERMDHWIGTYLDGHRPDDPRASPLLAQLAELPPTRFLSVGFDPLRDEGRELVERLREAGNEVELTVAPDIFHGFVNAAGVSRRAREVLTDFAHTLN